MKTRSGWQHGLAGLRADECGDAIGCAAVPC